jgi:hypothetical protein
MAVTYVSAIVDIYNGNGNDKEVDIRKTKEARIDRFKELAQSGIQLVLFCCPTYYPLLTDMLKEYTNVKLLDIVKLSDLLVYKICQTYESNHKEQLSLPMERSFVKDTREYMILMNSKVEFLLRAITANVYNTNYFCWIDFSYFYMINEQTDKNDIINKLIYLNKYLINSNRQFIMIPGNNNNITNSINNKDYLNSINWRFCGTSLIGDKNSLLDFCNKAFNLFPLFLQITNKLIWEVNYWMWMEQNGYFSPQWYHGRFDKSLIINIPL